MVLSYIRRKIELEVAEVRAQCLSLLGRLEGLGSGAVTAAGRKWKTVETMRQ